MPKEIVLRGVRISWDMKFTNWRRVAMIASFSVAWRFTKKSYNKNTNAAPSYLGSMLFQRQVSGCRVVTITKDNDGNTANKLTNINNYQFQNWGSHINNNEGLGSYFTVACAVGMTESDLSRFLIQLGKCFHKLYSAQQTWIVWTLIIHENHTKCHKGKDWLIDNAHYSIICLQIPLLRLWLSSYEQVSAHNNRSQRNTYFLIFWACKQSFILVIIE